MVYEDIAFGSQEPLMKKSIGDNEIPQGWGFERGLELIKKAGFDGVELWIGDVPWFEMRAADAEVLALRRRADGRARGRSDSRASRRQR